MQDIYRFDWHIKVVNMQLAADRKSKKNYSKLFHISSIRNRPQIFQYGLLPQSRNGVLIKYSPTIFFSKKA